MGGLVLCGHWHAKRQARRLAAKRDGMAPWAMIDGLVASGIAEPVAEFLWDAISPYYGEGDILPHPDDDLATEAGIDSEDVEDMVADFFRLFAMPEPTAQSPETIPSPLSIAGFARYLNERRIALQPCSGPV
jgi:hypothetical protein